MSVNFLHRIKGLLFILAIEIAKQVGSRSLYLTKIDIATHYIQSISVIRKIHLSTSLLLLGILLASNIVLIGQISILLYAPWELWQKILVSFSLMFVSFSILLFFLFRFFSEEKWMEIFKGQEAIIFALGKNHSDQT